MRNGCDGGNHIGERQNIFSTERFTAAKECIRNRWKHRFSEVREDVPDTNSTRYHTQKVDAAERREHAFGESRVFCEWEAEPDVCRVVDGISEGLDHHIWRERIKALGNAVVPQVAETIGEMILDWERENATTNLRSSS